MDSKANYSLIGFVSALVAALVMLFLYWFVFVDANAERVRYDIVFTGTVTGLNTGTDVLYSGIPMGEVESIGLDPDDPTRVIARIAVSPEAPVRTDTRAILEFQGLTGVAYLQLVGGSASAPRLDVSQPGIPRIIAEKSDFQSIVDGVRDTIAGASRSFDRLERFLDDNEGAVRSTLANVESFTAALGNNSEGVDEFLSTLSEAGAEIGPLAVELKQLSADVRGLIGDVEPGQVAKIVDDVAGFTTALAEGTETVSIALDDVGATAGSLRAYADDLSPTMAALKGIADALDVETITDFLANMSSMGEVIGSNSETTESFFSDMSLVGERLESASRRLDQIMANVDSMTADADGTGLFDDLSEAARAIETLATNLDARTATIANGANGGLSQFEAFAIEAQAVLARLDRVLGNLERNPQSIVFGGASGNVRDYNKE